MIGPPNLTLCADNIIETQGALILGGGIAGLFAALKLAPMPALVIAGARPGRSGSSIWAQGGIAVAIGAGDTWERHMADTVNAGAGLSDPALAALLAREGVARVSDLLRLGTPFNRDAKGELSLGLEAAHGTARIVHVQGDRTGAVISGTLAKAAQTAPSITLLEGFHAIELAVQDGRVVGLFARQGTGASARLVLFRAPAVILATGGLSALYAVTTNPPDARGEGLGMAARAGARIADPEFVQFHPTAIATQHDPAPLATEALRGAGAFLVDETGKRFMTAIHADADLAPRDIVARAVHRQIARGGKVYLDCTVLGATFPERFPTVHAAAMAAGVDPVSQLLPVAPAAHYHMGGIATDLYARTSLEGLWACGECAGCGVHGANRLASNSLLEALVFSARAAEDVKGRIAPRARIPAALDSPGSTFGLPPPKRLRELMTRNVGIERDADGLKEALAEIQAIERAGGASAALRNMTAAAKLVAAGALARCESRGAHFRSDYPFTKETPQRTLLTLAQAEQAALNAAESTSRTKIA